MNGIEHVLAGLIEVKLSADDDFLKVKETLTRIGIPSSRDKTLVQTCHILHKKGLYYITHFKELFALDGRVSTMSTDDYARRNKIAAMLASWGMYALVDAKKSEEPAGSVGMFKVIKHAEKGDWKLTPKYNIGVRKYRGANA